jgi:prepilin-type N-terminal cleavage/methylation domain-containing protein
MKLSRDYRPEQPRQGMTLVEMSIVTTIMVLVLGALLASHLFGLKLYALTRGKLETIRSVRRAVSRLTEDIYSANGIYVAVGLTNRWIPMTNAGMPRLGNALQIWTTPTNYVLYYWNPADFTLRRQFGLAEEILASSILNSSNLPIFALQDCSGQALTGDEGNTIVRVRLEYRATNYPSRELMDYYKFETCVTARNQVQP